MTIELIAYLLPAILAVLAVPLALGMVPPNPLYGFRTSKTLSSPDIWYPANRFAGWLMIAAGALTLCFNYVFLSMRSNWADAIVIPWLAGALVVFMLLGAVASMFYLRKL
jgi:uncharacterized membrane protein